MNRTLPATSFPSILVRRPLSAAIAFGLQRRLAGRLYLAELNDVDAFTPVMIAALPLRGLWRLRRDTDLPAVSISLIHALSFIFVYEAIYKILFYLPPRQTSPEELRELLIQAGTGLTVLAGFAFRKFRLTRTSLVFLSAFVLVYLFWLLSGFPQIDHVENYYPALIHLPFTWNMFYAVNRSTKVLLFLAYFFIGDYPLKARIVSFGDSSDCHFERSEKSCLQERRFLSRWRTLLRNDKRFISKILIEPLPVIKGYSPFHLRRRSGAREAGPSSA